MGLWSKFKKKKPTKTVIIGLDGVPHSMLMDLKSRNCIPSMSSIFSRGHFERMSVCIPEISSVSWSSFMTGQQSGVHGIFGFIDLEPSTYKMYFPNFTHLKSSTLWEDLAEKDKKSIVINMPSTYPAKPINGALISGFVAIDLNKAVFPSSLVARLNDLGYRIDVNTIEARNDHGFLFKDLSQTLAIREKTTEWLWDNYDWDLFIVVITGTDRLLHFLYDAYDDPNHRYHEKFTAYFKQVDDFIGRIYERFTNLEGSAQGDNHFLMLSDHGFTKIKTEVYLNRWLQDNGYLKFQNDTPETIMDIDEGSTAFALDPSRIYINQKGKYPMGSIDAIDCDKIINEIVAGLKELAFDGGFPIIKNVYRKEELYHGPFLKTAPDLVLLSEHGYDLKGRVNSATVFARTDLSGMHTQDDAFVFSSKGYKIDTIFEIKDRILKDY